MAEVLYLKINKRLNVERSILPEHLKYLKKLSGWNYEMNLCQKTNMRIDKILSNAKYRKDEPFQNLPIFLRIFVILQIW